MRGSGSIAVLLSLFPLAALAAPAIPIINDLTNTDQATGNDSISSCGDTWMAGADAGDRRTLDQAAEQFCTDADTQTVKAEGFLSLATEVWISGGGPPQTHGLPGYVYFEVHNKGGDEHKVEKQKCIDTFKKLTEEGSKCRGNDNKDSKGGTVVQVENVSYHAIGENVRPSPADALNKLSDKELSRQPVDKKGQALDPWPIDAFDEIRPLACHSHNDYDHDIPLYEALTAGCVSVEVDIHAQNGEAQIGHDFGEAGRTLGKQYVAPIKEMIDANKAVFKSDPKQSLTLLIDFKTSGQDTFDAISKDLEPLRSAGYLSTAEGDTFTERQVTVVLTGSSTLDQVKANQNKDMFLDAPVDKLDEEDYSASNSNYASGQWSKVVGGSGTLDEAQKKKVQDQVSKAHGKGLKVRYWDLPDGDELKNTLIGLGVDRINVDDLPAVAGLRWTDAQTEA